MGRLHVLSIALAAVAATGCSYDFDIFQPVDDGGADARSDASGGDGGASDAGADGACTPDLSCTQAAGTCGTTCGTTSKTCQDNCKNNFGCRQNCKSAEQTCRSKCQSDCETCATNAGCPAKSECQSAAFN